MTKTRMILWKEYRDSIEKNISLQKSVKISNEKLKILHKRLINVFPEYDTKYPSNLSKFTADVQNISEASTISNEKIDKMLQDIHNVENIDDSSFNAINKINFESGDLTNVVKILERGNINNKREYSLEEENVVMNESYEIKLRGKMSEYKIAIDGPSGSGKSTVAKLIANKYGLKYVNTGLVYRSIAFKLIELNIDMKNKRLVTKNLKNCDIKLLKDEIVNLNGVNLKSELRSDKVSQAASIIASYSSVRKFATKIQINEATSNGVIMDGRDTTFKIMPNADFKFFLDTDADTRARRRVEQNSQIGFSTNYQEILSEIKIRDHRDRNRKVDPLHKTEDAFLIDTSKMTIDDVVNKIVSIIEK